MNASLDPLSHTLGRIENALETITKTQGEDRVASATYRTDMRREMTTIRETMSDLKHRVNENADQLADMRPDVEDYRIRKVQGVFGWGIIKTVWTVVIGLGVAGMGAIIHAIWPAAK